jgi:hypothetical protein
MPGCMVFGQLTVCMIHIAMYIITVFYKIYINATNLKCYMKNILFWTEPSRPKSSRARTVGEDSLDVLLDRGRAPQ